MRRVRADDFIPLLDIIWDVLLLSSHTQAAGHHFYVPHINADDTFAFLSNVRLWNGTNIGPRFSVGLSSSLG